jgi:hypothetical protein
MSTFSENIIEKISLTPVFMEEKDEKTCECCICMDVIDYTKNFTRTECGHEFHSTCLFQSFKEKDDCPLCRKVLIEYDNENNDEDDDDDYSDDNDSDDEDDNTDEDSSEGPKISIKQISDKMINLGWTMEDLVFMIIGEPTLQSDKEKFTEDKFDRLFDVFDKIRSGDIAVNYRDQRSYAQVAATIAPSQLVTTTESE